MGRQSVASLSSFTVERPKTDDDHPLKRDRDGRRDGEEAVELGPERASEVGRRHQARGHDERLRPAARASCSTPDRDAGSSGIHADPIHDHTQLARVRAHAVFGRHEGRRRSASGRMDPLVSRARLCSGTGISTSWKPAPSADVVPISTPSSATRTTRRCHRRRSRRGQAQHQRGAFGRRHARQLHLGLFTCPARAGLAHRLGVVEAVDAAGEIAGADLRRAGHGRRLAQACDVPLDGRPRAAPPPRAACRWWAPPASSAASRRAEATGRSRSARVRSAHPGWPPVGTRAITSGRDVRRASRSSAPAVSAVGVTHSTSRSKRPAEAEPEMARRGLVRHHDDVGWQRWPPSARSRRARRVIGVAAISGPASRRPEHHQHRPGQGDRQTPGRTASPKAVDQDPDAQSTTAAG